MSARVWADTTALTAAIDGLGLLDKASLADFTAGIDLQSKIDAATDRVEKVTGWKPFLMDSADVTRYYDPPGPNQSRFFPGGGYLLTTGGGRILDLEAGLLQLTSISYAYSDSVDNSGNVTVITAGTEYVRDTQFFLQPFNAPAEGKPYEWVQLLATAWGAVRSVIVVGRFGYAASIPGDLYHAHLRYALALCAPELRMTISRGVYMLQTLRTRAQYGGPGGMLLMKEEELWKQQFEDALLEYSRVVI